MNCGRLLILGCGDIARRAMPAFLERWQVTALARSPDEALSARGIEIAVGDLDRPETLSELSRGFERVIHFAPPPDAGTRDPRTMNAIDAFSAAAILPERFVYISTSGVYGDCAGASVTEERAVNPQTDRARRRMDAERALVAWSRKAGVSVAILRVPGIYAADRLPLARLGQGTPVLRADDDVYTNHIHADDLAAACVAALECALPSAQYNICDDSEMKMGDYFDLVADRFALERPPRIARAQAGPLIPPSLLSFMSESRRLVNTRMKRELGVRLRYPTVFDGVPHGHTARAHQPA
jgi:nucleoside-diphosphate-sugar epimerase